jgi:hypothetical protein
MERPFSGMCDADPSGVRIHGIWPMVQKLNYPSLTCSGIVKMGRLAVNAKRLSAANPRIILCDGFPTR